MYLSRWNQSIQSVQDGTLIFLDVSYWSLLLSNLNVGLNSIFCSWYFLQKSIFYQARLSWSRDCILFKESVHQLFVESSIASSYEMFVLKLRSPKKNLILWSLYSYILRSSLFKKALFMTCYHYSNHSKVLD